ncbi:MAG: YigZ family protein [Campylobacterota bacterium]|nr:YigZ family protein [Campylobacterota bacterium]
MQFINKEFTKTLEIKKSKFITHICPYANFKDMMNRLRKDHPKARHFVYAYRYLNEFDQIVENSSDDGEPKGTSGRPTLSVLSGAKIINSAVIVVRYFGGIKLGTGGLVKAYSDAVNLVLKSSQLNCYVKLEQKSLEISYSQLSQIEYLINKFNIQIKNKVFNDRIILTLESSSEEFDKLSKELFLDCKLIDSSKEI